MSVQRPNLQRIYVVEDSSSTILSRITLSDGTVATQADITSIDFSVYDLTARVSTAGGALVVADVIFDTLQPWDVDDIGYNFRHIGQTTFYPEGGRQYQIDYRFTPSAVGSEPFIVPIVADCQKVYIS